MQVTDRIITKIELRDDIKVDRHKFPDQYHVSFEGAVIQFNTGEQMIVGISAGQDCCEDYGYIISEDAVTTFIGAKLISYELIDLDKADQHNKLIDAEVYTIPKLYEGTAAFVDLNTDRGLLQLTVYNAHNGYYGHDVVVVMGEEILLKEIF